VHGGVLLSKGEGAGRVLEKDASLRRASDDRFVYSRKFAGKE
jgi:hypothetical protein